jgi:hypothetical protein
LYYLSFYVRVLITFWSLYYLSFYVRVLITFWPLYYLSFYVRVHNFNPHRMEEKFEDTKR